jgi:hypothetical protein
MFIMIMLNIDRHSEHSPTYGQKLNISSTQSQVSYNKHCYSPRTITLEN